jgi:hypothetical protein
VETLLQKLNRLREVILRNGDPLAALRINLESNRLTGLVEVFNDSRTSADAMATSVGYVNERIRTYFQALQERGRNPASGFEEVRAAIIRVADALQGSVPGFDRETFIEQSMTAAGRSLDLMRQKFQSWTDIAKDGVSKFSQSLADSIVDFATTGSESFAKMAEDFAKAMAKMILNALIFRAVMLTLRSVGIDLMMPSGRMAGGPVDAGTPYVVGEQRPELFVPGSSGYVFPTAGRSGEVTVNVYNNAAGTRATARESNDSSGGKTIEIFVEEVVNRGIATGKFDNTMGASYGAARIGRV